MRRRLRFIVVLCILGCAGCSTPTSILELKDLPSFVDVSLHGIVLQDPTSAETKLSADIKIVKEYGRCQAHFYNKDRYQIMTLTYHPDDQEHSFSEFAVTRVDKPGIVMMKRLPDVERFVSGKGIAVGMTIEAVTNLLGEPEDMKVEEYDIDTRMTTIYYTYAQGRYFARNHLEYYGEYSFLNDRLKYFMFGLRKKRVKR
jgi:hypothetical protein